MSAIHYKSIYCINMTLGAYAFRGLMGSIRTPAQLISDYAPFQTFMSVKSNKESH